MRLVLLRTKRGCGPRGTTGGAAGLVGQARQTLERKKNYKSNAISKQVFEDADTALKIAAAKLVAVEAQIEESRSTIEGDKANLNYTKIFAPMSGTVVLRGVREGQTLNASQSAPTIVQLADLDTMTVRAGPPKPTSCG